MATRVDLPPLPQFDPLSDQSTLSQRWKSWMKRFETYLVAANITDDEQKRAMLLYQAGSATQDIFETFADTGTDYATAKKKLNDYFAPKKNVDYEIFQFRQATQLAGESVEQFATRLRKIAVNCEFHNVDKEIKSAIIQHCHSKCLRRYALREDALTLENLLAKARSLEVSELQATGMEEKGPSRSKLSDVGINLVDKRRHKGASQQSSRPRCPRPQPAVQRNPQPTTCRKCGKSWPHKQGPCPAKGQTCRKCGKPNHFARMCLTPTNRTHNTGQQREIKAVAAETDSSSSDEEYLYSTGKDKSKVSTVNVKVNDVEIEMIVDTGASTDILDEDSFSQINRSNEITLQPTTKRLFAYGSTDQLVTMGQFNGTISFRGNQHDVSIHVLKGKNGSLLSYKTATALGILNLQLRQVRDDTSPQHVLPTKYPTLFHGIGKLKGVEVKLHIDQTVAPVAQQPRRIPFHIRQKVEAKLLNLEEKGIIERVEGPTPWVSPLVITPKKNGEVRVCVDMRMANRAIRRERHPMPTVDDLIHTLNGATVFSKLDLRSGYHQLSLAPESRYITTFATNKGLWRYTRLNFGTNSASEIFQKRSAPTRFRCTQH